MITGKGYYNAIISLFYGIKDNEITRGTPYSPKAIMQYLSWTIKKEVFIYIPILWVNCPEWTIWSYVLIFPTVGAVTHISTLFEFLQLHGNGTNGPRGMVGAFLPGMSV